MIKKILRKSWRWALKHWGMWVVVVVVVVFMVEVKWSKESGTSGQVQLRYYEYVQLSHPLSISLWRINRLDWIVILCTGHLLFTINSANCFYLFICHNITRAISNTKLSATKRGASLETIDIKQEQLRSCDFNKHVDTRIQASFSWVSWLSYRLHRRLFVHCSVIITVRSIVQQKRGIKFYNPFLYDVNGFLKFCIFAVGETCSSGRLKVVIYGLSRPERFLTDASSLTPVYAMHAAWSLHLDQQLIILRPTVTDGTHDARSIQYNGIRWNPQFFSPHGCSGLTPSSSKSNTNGYAHRALLNCLTPAHLCPPSQ